MSAVPVCVCLSRSSPQVAAYCDGRDSVSEFDCLLLEHVLWQEPEHAAKISDWLLAQLAVDDGMKQVGCLCVCVWGVSMAKEVSMSWHVSVHACIWMTAGTT